MRRAVLSWLVAGLVAGATAIGSAVALAPAAHADTWVAPVISREIGAPASAEVYAWGVDYNPVTSELLVGDYVNKTVRRYSASGAYLGNTDGPTNVGLYAGLGVDPRDGSFYVGTQQGPGGVILKFNSAGHFLYSFDPPGLSPYVTVDAAGYVYINQRTNGYEIDKLAVSDSTHSYTVVQRFSAPGGTWYNDIAVASDGRVFAVQQDQYRVRVFNAAGQAIGQIGSKGEGPGKFDGDMRGVAINEAANRIYVVDGEADAIEVFTLDGTYVATWGSVGSGPGQFQDGGRQIAVGTDGTVYVADYGNFRVVKFSPNGAPETSIPNPSADPDSWGFNSLMDVAYDPTTGNVLGVDSYNQRFQRFSSTGQLLDIRGRRGNSPPYGMNYPKGIAVDPASGEVWVVDDELGNPDILTYHTDGSFSREIVEPTRRRAVEIYNGEAYIIASGLINVRSVATGALNRSWYAYGRNLGIDPANGNVYVPNGNTVAIFSSAGASLGSLSGGTALYDATVVGNVVYVTDTTGDRILAFDKNTRALLGSFGSAGSGPGQLNAPAGIDSDPAGNLYVADRANDRIDVFSPGSFPVDTTAPTVALTSPASGATLAPGPSVISGTAADADSGVASVEVALQDSSSGLWWDAKASNWGARQVWNAAPVWGSLASAQWRFGFVGATFGRNYQVLARARDRVGLVSTKVVKSTFGVGDATPPTTTITAPAGGVLPAGTVNLAGTATDNIAVNAVQLSVQDQTAGTWWSPQTLNWVATQTWFSGDLATPGAASSTWTSSVPANVAGDQYVVSAQAVDEVGQVDPSPPSVGFGIDGSDVTPPSTSVTGVSRPGLAGSTVTVSGTATDNVSVAGVQVAVQNTGNGKWLSSTGTFGSTQTFFSATLGTPNSTTTTWSFAAAMGNGSYLVVAKAVDGAGNVDPTGVQTAFKLNDFGGDITPPTATISSPLVGTPVSVSPTLTGTATDDLGVATVDMTIKNKTTGQFWNGSGFVTGAVNLPGVLSSPNAASTGWSLATTLPIGSYVLTVRATDVANRVSLTKPTVSFDVTDTTGQISVDRWDGYSGNTLASIAAGTPATSTSTVAAPSGLIYSPNADNYGARMRVLLRPTATGDYTFWLSADDQGTLRVGPATADPATMPTIARVPAYTAVGAWTTYRQQQSAPVHLIANTDYYLEVAYKEAGGGDFAEVAWQLGGTLTPTLIPASAFRPAGSIGATGGWRAQIEVTGGTATQSSTAFNGYASLARDGNTDGVYADGSVTHSDYQAQPYWGLDLGSTANLTQIQLWGRTDCCTDRLTNVHVFASASPFTSTDPNVLASTPGVQSAYITGQLGVTTSVPLSGAPVRYIRVQLDGTNYLNLAEVRTLIN